jgi:hypothetical protein
MPRYKICNALHSFIGCRLIKILFLISKENKRLKKDDCTPATMLSDLANKRPDDVCFYFEDDTWTYKQVMMHNILFSHSFLFDAHILFHLCAELLMQI